LILVFFALFFAADGRLDLAVDPDFGVADFVDAVPVLAAAGFLVVEVLLVFDVAGDFLLVVGLVSFFAIAVDFGLPADDRAEAGAAGFCFAALGLAGAGSDTSLFTEAGFGTSSASTSSFSSFTAFLASAEACFSTDRLSANCFSASS
jgi:hypothetical protein